MYLNQLRNMSIEIFYMVYISPGKHSIPYSPYLVIKPPTHPVATKWRSNESISVEFRVFISELGNIDKSFRDYHGKQGN